MEDSFEHKLLESPDVKLNVVLQAIESGERAA